MAEGLARGGSAPPGSADHPGLALVVAAVLGTLHALVSFYWGLGGTALVRTLGERLLTQFAGRAWLLLPVGAVKLVVALAPLWLSAPDRPYARLVRGTGWLAAAVLVLWGGLNTLVGNLVLAGVVVPSDGYDRDAMVGHAWLWDPLFLLWGLALAAGLRWTRRARPA